jgi:ribosome-binding protein aMBF1 (putative translation factor)
MAAPTGPGTGVARPLPCVTHEAPNVGAHRDRVQPRTIVAVRANLRLDVGTRIRKAREALGISQEALAERAGLHRNHVGSVERGEREIEISNLASLARALGVSLAEFFAPFRGTVKPRR